MKDAPLDAKSRLSAAGLRPKKSWGQNFLTDGSVHQTIASALGSTPGATVVELGAGLGALTHYLVEGGACVVAIERDRELVPLLREQFAGQERLEVIESNAATLDFGALCNRLDVASVRVAGNLPYQLSSRILVSLADAADFVERAVVLVQREVADRLAAAPGGKQRGLLSVLVQRRFAVRRLRTVPPGAFHPPPKVHSAVVELRRERTEIDLDVDRALVEVARLGFVARRKSLRNNYKQHVSDVEALFSSAGIDSIRRAETLSLEEWARLAQSWPGTENTATTPTPLHRPHP